VGGFKHPDLEPILGHVFSLSLFPSDGTCVRDYLHVMDLAHGHVLALQALQGQAKTDVFADYKEDGAFRAFNLGSGAGQSVLQIAAAMTKASGVKFNQQIVGRR
jgi:UDP-glucose 4-epimerase